MPTMRPRLSHWFLLGVVCFGTLHQGRAKIRHKVKCHENFMLVELEKPEVDTRVYLQNLRNFPEVACHPTHVDDHKATLNISLANIFQCGVTRMANRITGSVSFQHSVVLENGDRGRKDIIRVKCVSAGVFRNITKRSVLPAGFSEQEDIESTTTLTKTAPEPVLKVGVRQGNNVIDGELIVKPGTPLTMEIYLDKESKPIYGLLVSYMRVSDGKAQDETVIFNGCSVDPYLFENFNTEDGDLLAAKFRAFKFPESTYVQFTGTVNICLDKCKGVECSNGQTGYGRRRKREIPGIPYDPKKVFEVTLTTFIKVDFKEVQSKGKLNAILKEKRESEIPVLTPNKTHKISFENLYDYDPTEAEILYMNREKDLKSANFSIFPSHITLILSAFSVYFYNI